MTGFRQGFFGNGHAAPRVEPELLTPPMGRGRPKIMGARNQQIRDERVAGLSIADLCEKYQLSIGSVYKITNGLLPRAARSPTAPVKAERDVKLTLEYEQGANTPALAEKYGVTRERVCQILRRSNVIEYRAERRRIAKEAFEAEVAALQGEAKADFEQKLAQAIELVRAGKSLASAGRQVGFTGKKVNYLGRACKKVGVETRHGRWRSQQQKADRARELRATGMKWTTISEICRREGLGSFNATFVSRNLPDLVTEHPKQIDNSAQRPTKRIRKAAKPNPDAVWDEDRTARLINLWLNGCSAQQCVDALGFECTRNMVIGKVYRLRADGKLKAPTHTEPQAASSLSQNAE